MTEPVRSQGKTFGDRLLWLWSSKRDSLLLISIEDLLTALTLQCLLDFGIDPSMELEEIYATANSFFYGSEAFKGLWHIQGGDYDLFVQSVQHRKKYLLS